MTNKFKDIGGREWAIVLDVYSIEAIKETCGVDLYSVFSEDGTAARLFGDIRQLVNVLYVAVKDQADRAGVSDIDFGKSIRGDILDDASNALLVGVADFYPSRQRTLKLAMLSKSRATTTAAIERLTTAVEAIDPTTFFTDATNSPDQSASVSTASTAGA